MRAKATPPVERTCEWCGVRFLIGNGRLRQSGGRFHSRACWRAWLRGRWTPDQLASRFWERVAIGEPDVCWPWEGGTGGGTGGEYGTVYWDGGSKLAHRVAYFLANGEWPVPQANHHCDHPACCNPAHLYAGTAKQNAEDAVARGRRTRVDPFKLVRRDALLNEQRVRLIRRLLAEGWSKRDVARLAGVSRHTINDIATGRTWAHVL